MKKGRYILIHMDKRIHRFRTLEQAKLYAIGNYRGSYEFYVIIDTEKDEVVYKWYY